MDTCGLSFTIQAILSQNVHNFGFKKTHSSSKGTPYLTTQTTQTKLIHPIKMSLWAFDGNVGTKPLFF